MKKIIFTNTTDSSISEKYYPKPASFVLPEWYKKTQSYLGKDKNIGFDGSITSTIKKCIPVFDALTSGYIISTHCDIIIKKIPDTNEVLYMPSEANTIEFHSVEQAPYHPNMNHHPYPKFINPWGIKTPLGYSCFFMPPVHGGNKFFTIIEGVVDTDTYSAPVNFPFVLKDINFEGLIPAGTPIAQVIPFKREEWKMINGNEEELQNIKNINRLLGSKFFDRYKTLFWFKKSYR